MTFQILNPITAPFWGGGEEWKEGSEPDPSYQAQCSCCNRLSAPAMTENGAVLAALAGGWTVRLPEPLIMQLITAEDLTYMSEVLCSDCAALAALKT
jgi:hypothetical protein